MSIHTENLARRIGAQLLLAMAEQSLTFDEVAKNLSAPDDTGSGRGRVPAAQVRNLILDLAQGKDASMAVVAQLAWGVNRTISPRLEPQNRTMSHDEAMAKARALLGPDAWDEAVRRRDEAVPPRPGAARIEGRELTGSDNGRFVVHSSGQIGLLSTWYTKPNERWYGIVMVTNSVEKEYLLSSLRFATRAEVEADPSIKGVGHTPIYAGEEKKP